VCSHASIPRGISVREHYRREVIVWAQGTRCPRHRNARHRVKQLHLIQTSHDLGNTAGLGFIPPPECASTGSSNPNRQH
jgi:hypothetical protein